MRLFMRDDGIGSSLRGQPLLLSLSIGIVLIVFFLGSKALPLAGRFIGGMDVGDIHYWCMHFLREQVLSGSFPLWNPHMYCGHPFAANPGNFVFYPLIPIYILFPLPWAFTIDLVLHLIIGWVGMFLLVRTMTGSVIAALVASVVYTFNGQLTGRIILGHLYFIHSAAIMPWVFLAMETVFQKNNPRLFVLAGLALGVMILTGNAQVIYYTALFVVIYLPVRYVFLFGFRDIRRFISYCAWFLLVPAVSFGVSAVFLLPAAEFISLSDRAQKMYEFATFMSFSPSRLFTLLVPRPETAKIPAEWELECYAGVSTLVLAAAGAFLSRSRWTSAAVSVMLLVSMTFVFGGHLPFYRLYFEYLPLIGQFRIPGRALTVSVLFLSVLAGMGASLLAEASDRKPIGFFLCAVTTLMLMLITAGALVFDVPIFSVSVVRAYVFTVVAGGALCALVFLKNRQTAATAVIVCLFADLSLAYAPVIPTIKEEDITAPEQFEAMFKDSMGDYRVMVPISLDPQFLASPLGARCNAMGYENAGGFLQAALMDYYRFVHETADVQIPVLLRHTLSMDLFRPEKVFSSKILGIKYALVQSPAGWSLQQANWYMPRVQLVHRARVVPDYLQHLPIIKDPSFNPQEMVLLEQADPVHLGKVSMAGADTASKDQARITRYEPDRILISTSSVSASYLLLSELYYPGWKAYVDGKRVPVIRADYLLRAVPLEAGRHEVEMVFRPASFMLGLGITVVTIIALAIAALLWARRGSRCGPQESEDDEISSLSSPGGEENNPGPDAPPRRRKGRRGTGRSS